MANIMSCLRRDGRVLDLQGFGEAEQVRRGLCLEFGEVHRGRLDVRSFGGGGQEHRGGRELRPGARLPDPAGRVSGPRPKEDRHCPGGGETDRREECGSARKAAPHLGTQARDSVAPRQPGQDRNRRFRGGFSGFWPRAPAPSGSAEPDARRSRSGHRDRAHRRSTASRGSPSASSGWSSSAATRALPQAAAPVCRQSRRRRPDGQTARSVIARANPTCAPSGA